MIELASDLNHLALKRLHYTTYVQLKKSHIGGIIGFLTLSFELTIGDQIYT